MNIKSWFKGPEDEADEGEDVGLVDFGVATEETKGAALGTFPDGGFGHYFG